MKSTVLKFNLLFVLYGMAAFSQTDCTIQNPNKMFTAEQLKTAHAKVKSGADFPSYIREIRALGVTNYETYVSDGHTNYYGGGHTVAMPARYAALEIAGAPNEKVFRGELLAHQQGRTDFLTFIKTCAALGIEKWEIDIGRMTCTYFDRVGNRILVEEIPR